MFCSQRILPEPRGSAGDRAVLPASCRPRHGRLFTPKPAACCVEGVCEVMLRRKTFWILSSGRLFSFPPPRPRCLNCCVLLKHKEGPRGQSLAGQAPSCGQLCVVPLSPLCFHSTEGCCRLKCLCSPRKLCPTLMRNRLAEGQGAGRWVCWLPADVSEQPGPAAPLSSAPRSL